MSATPAKTSARTKVRTKPMKSASGREASDPGARIRDLIREVIANAPDPDPHDLAWRIVAEMPGDAGLADWLVRYAVADLVREVLHALRSPASDGPVRTGGPSRWKRYRVTVKRLGASICVDGAWKWVEECTALDLAAYAAEQRGRARALDTAADAAEDLAGALAAHGFATVKDWDDAGRPGAVKDLAA